MPCFLLEAFILQLQNQVQVEPKANDDELLAEQAIRHTRDST
jgi:hypothetical protein